MAQLQYYKNLDGLRGIAALMVVFFHFFSFPISAYHPDIRLYQQLTEFGQHGVSLFFVLSGFVITRILINTRGNESYLSSFFYNRLLRIAPLYYVFLLAWYLVSVYLVNRPIDFNKFFPYLLYLQNIYSTFGLPLKGGPGHFWSLAVEEHFYLFWPFVVLLVPTRYLMHVATISILAVLGLKYFMLDHDFSINHFTFTRIDQILMGSFLALLETRYFFKQKKAAWFFLGTMALIVPLGIGTYLLSTKILLIKEMMKYFILGILFFSVIGFLLSIHEKNIINRFLTHRVLQYLGRISYGIYVWHVLIILVLTEFFVTKNLLLDLLVYTALTIVTAHISYFYFESFFLKFKRSNTVKPLENLSVERSKPSLIE